MLQNSLPPDGFYEWVDPDACPEAENPEPDTRLPSMAESIALSDEQELVYQKLLDGVAQGRAYQRIGAVAGAGKSVLLSKLVTDDLTDWAVAGFTGQSADVLRQKGVEQAQTIHSLIYEPDKNKLTGEVVFRLKDSIGVGGIAIDEGSMVPQQLWNDLLTFRLPIVVFGDHFQLEPINGDGFNLMTDPDYTLMEVYRYSGELYFFAEHLREGKRPEDFITSSDPEINRVHFVDDEIDGEYAALADVTICAFNSTRVGINRKARAHLGHDPDRPQVGDRIVCLRNKTRYGVFNGMRGVITAIDRDRFELDFASRDRTRHRIPYDPDQFGQEKTLTPYSSHFVPFDYAWANTAHKMQGSQEEKVIVIEQFCKLWSHPRWCYTSATRTKGGKPTEGGHLIWKSQSRGRKG